MADFIPGEVNLFEERPLNRTIVKRRTAVYNPVTPLSVNQENIWLHLSTDGETEAINLKNMQIETEIQILKDGKPVEEKFINQYGPINNFALSIFQSVSLLLNGQNIETQGHFPYLSLIKTLLNTEQIPEYKLELMQLFVKDSGFLNALSPVTSELTNVNAGLTARWNYLKQNNGKYIMRAPLTLSVSSVDHLLPAGVNLDLKIQRNNNEFLLMSKDNDFEVKLLNIRWMVERIQLADDVILGYQHAMQQNDAIYNYIEDKIDTYILNSGMKVFELQNIFSKLLVDQCIIFMVDLDASIGNFQKNGLVMTAKNLNEITIKVDNSFVQSQSMDLSSNNILQPYSNLFDLNPKLQIKPQDYIETYPLFYFKLREVGKIANEIKKSKVDLKLEFSDHLEHNLLLFVYSTYNSKFYLNKSGEVKNEYM